jgi:hypothetical protein
MMNKLLVTCALLVVGGSAFAASTLPGGGNNVPEPGTLALVALAVVAGVVARRGKK